MVGFKLNLSLRFKLSYGYDFKCVIFRCIEVIIFMNIAGAVGFS